MSSFLSNRRFLKMNGLGNEIVVLDLRGEKHIVTPEEARAIASDKRSAFDQMMVLHDPVNPDVDAYMRIYNADGSEVGGCGNGTRCVAWAMMSDPEISKGFTGHDLHLETMMGALRCYRHGDLDFMIDMGSPRFGWQDIPLANDVGDTLLFDVPLANHQLVPAAGVNVGNPHIVFFVEDISQWDIEEVGPLLEGHNLFPERANISFAQRVGRDHFRTIVWERGAGATRACGTAACAIGVLGQRRNLSGRVSTISLPGGDLHIEWRARDNHILMTGPVELEWEDRFKPDIFNGVN